LLNQAQKVAAAPERVALALQKVARRLAYLRMELSLLGPDPSELGHGEDPQGLQTQVDGCGEANPAVGRINT
jgi:hypothetical protein